MAFARVSCGFSGERSIPINVALAANTVYQGDCVRLLRELEPGSVHLVFADPPFNIGYEYDVYDDQRQSGEYLDWCRQWIEAVRDCLKPDGTFWLAIGDEFAAELKVLACQSGFHCRSWVIWYYTFGVNCRRGFSRSHTHLFHFVRDAENFTFNESNPQIRVKSARELVYGDRRASPSGRLPDNTWIIRPQDLPDSFRPHHDTWYFARVAGTFRERQGFHGCQMPEQLLGRIIRTSSRPGELVVDPFSGSGTTLAVAKKLGRQWMGFELSPEYAKAIQKRLGSIKPGDALDGPEDPVQSAPSTGAGRKLKRKGGDQELLAAIAEVFRAAAQGKSVDYLMCDPELNAAFVAGCRKAGLDGNEIFWNELLLRLRKAGKLAGTGRQPAKKHLDACTAAGEIAMRLISLDTGLSLDKALCSPGLARAFDEYAEGFAPGYRSFDYRWAALGVRKRASAARSKAGRDPAIAEWGSMALPKFHPWAKVAGRPPAAPGIYLLRAGKEILYVGETNDLGERIQSTIAARPWRELEASSIAWAETKARDAAGIQAALAARFHPMLNTELLWQGENGE